ncbi:MAG: (2Fe-2S)-binding protein, partial [Alphaproteobacteria bacterium]|nr:(2Fe-2S)-binding protein [Alphaproteobacteria bacterium]
TVLLKSQGVLPGRSTVVAGCGPLLAAVAVGILKAGGRVEAVVDLAGARDWLAGVPDMLSRPDLLRQGAGWLAVLAKARVPLYRRHAVVAARTREGGLDVAIRPVDAAGALLLGGAERIVSADCLAIGHGLVPSTEVTRLLRARHRFASERGGWIAETDGEFRTSVPGLFVAGDAAGISGAVPALHKGRIAGLAAAHDLGLIDRERFDALAAGDRRALARAERFGRAAARLMSPRPALAATMTPDTVVCRCEDVTRAEIETAIGDGAADLNQLKAWTRCGMGPCQGRTCGEAAAMLLAAHVGGRDCAGFWTGRAPLRPVPLAPHVGDIGYDDNPLPKAAPL